MIEKTDEGGVHTTRTTPVLVDVPIVSRRRWSITTSSSVCEILDIMMSSDYFKYVRTTLSLDDDVAAQLKAETRRSGRSLKEVVNEYLRLGLHFHSKRSERSRRTFRVEARDLGALRPGLSLDNVADLLEQIEGPLHR